MELDYKAIGRRIANRRKKLGLKQFEVEERAEISYKYLSHIERGSSIPSTEALMRIAAALETTPDEFLVGTATKQNEEWKSIAEPLRGMNEKQLALARSFILWLSEQEL